MFIMRKLLLFIIVSVLFSLNLKAQETKRENVARECVLYEIFTGIRCSNCPAVALGMARMIEEGKSVAALAYHTSAFSTPDLYTTETNSRAMYYSIAGYPTVITDGQLCVSGGGPADYADMTYSGYLLPKYNQAISKTSPFTIDLSVEYDSGTKCIAKATVNKVGDCTANNVRLFMALSESHIQRSWQGLDELNFVVRDMLPDHNGKVLSNNEESQTFEELFDVNGYDRNNCEIVAWVQNYQTKEVYQAMKFSLADIPTQNDVRIEQVDDLVLATCSGRISPCIKFVNNGSEMLNSVMFKFKDQDANELSSYTWEGNIAKGESAEFMIPNIDILSSTKVMIEAAEVNGTSDDFPVDNIKEFELESAADVKGYIKFQMKTSSNPEELVINLRNMDTDEVVNTYLYDQPKKTVKEDIYMPTTGCYRMEFLNSAGKGLDGAFFQMQDADNNVIFTSLPGTNDFKYSLNVDIYSSTVVGVNDVKAENVNIYPNPATSVINVSVADMRCVSVYNAMGQLVYNMTTESDNVKIDADSWMNGVYYVNVETTDGSAISQKIIVNK